MKGILSLLILLAFDLHCQSQESKLVISPYFDYNYLNLVGFGVVYNKNPSGYIYEKYNVYVGEGNQNMDGFRLGVLVTQRWHDHNFYYRVNYYQNSAFSTIINLHPEDEVSLGIIVNSDIVGYLYKRIESKIKFDVFKFKKLSFSTGLGGYYHIKSEEAKIPDSYYDNLTTYEKQHKIYSNLAQSYLRVVANAEVSLNYRFGPLLLGFNVERSITPMSNYVVFNGVMSRLKQTYTGWSWSISYDLFKIKSKNN